MQQVVHLRESLCTFLAHIHILILTHTRLVSKDVSMYDKNHIHEIAGLTIHDIDIQVAEISRKIQEIDYNLQYRKNRHTLHFEVLAKVSVFIQSIEYMTTVTIQ